MNFARLIAIVASVALTSAAYANNVVNMNITAENGVGESAGNVQVSETKYGLMFTPDLHGLPPGVHGFHIHENPSCDKDGMAAGGHFDPKKTGKHLGPYNNQGHLGDLPAIYVNADGTSTLPVVAPKLHHVSEIKNHSLRVHHAGDNYSDAPEKLGGGGARMACGVIS